MGSPKFPRKKYTTPFHPWKEDRIKSERELMKKYGLKNHKEVWKAKTYLGKYRGHARELLAKMGAKEDPQVKKESDQLLLHLTKMGILSAGSSLDDVLALETESVLSRRLQTLVYLKGLSTTPDQSRQLINHGHIAIGERKVTIPSYMVIKDEENKIGYTGISPLNELSHPARPKIDVYKTGVTAVKEEKAEEPPKSKEASDRKEGKTKEVKKEDIESAKEEKTDVSEKIKEETTKEKPAVEKETTEPKKDLKKSPESKEASDRKEEKTKEGKKEDIESAKEEKTDASEKITEETTKEKPAVEKETTEPAEQSKSTKQEKPAKEEKPEPPSKAEEEKPVEEKTEPVKKSETGNKNAKETNKKKGAR